MGHRRTECKTQAERQWNVKTAALQLEVPGGSAAQIKSLRQIINAAPPVSLFLWCFASPRTWYPTQPRWSSPCRRRHQGFNYLILKPSQTARLAQRILTARQPRRHFQMPMDGDGTKTEDEGEREQAAEGNVGRDASQQDKQRTAQQEIGVA